MAVVPVQCPQCQGIDVVKYGKQANSPRQGILYSGGELTRPCLGNIRSTSTQSRTAPRQEPSMCERKRVSIQQVTLVQHGRLHSPRR
jgi:hypothetical protein